MTSSVWGSNERQELHVPQWNIQRNQISFGGVVDLGQISQTQEDKELW
jgi:hypothetical protein